MYGGRDFLSAKYPRHSRIHYANYATSYFLLHRLEVRCIVPALGDLDRQDAAGECLLSPYQVQGPADTYLEALGAFAASVRVDKTSTTIPTSAINSSIPYFTESTSRCVPFPIERSLRCSRSLLPQDTPRSTNAHRENRSEVQSRPVRGPVCQGWRLCYAFARRVYDA